MKTSALAKYFVVVAVVSVLVISASVALWAPTRPDRSLIGARDTVHLNR